MMEGLLRGADSDCLAPFRIVLLGGAISFVQLFASMGYAKLARDGRERNRRLAVLLSSVGFLFAAAFAASCVRVCDTSPPCPRAYDLDCGGRSREIYAAGAVGLLIAWATLLTWEAAWRVTHRGGTARPE